jgi:hypothetical protein
MKSQTVIDDISGKTQVASNLITSNKKPLNLIRPRHISLPPSPHCFKFYDESINQVVNPIRAKASFCDRIFSLSVNITDCKRKVSELRRIKI